MLPNLGVKLEEENFGNIKNVIEEAINSSSLEKSRNKVKEMCWANIGNSAEKSVLFLIDKRNEMNKEKEKCKA